jgi:hypothetical protein
VTRIDVPARSAAAATPRSKWMRPAREQRRLTAEERELRSVAERDFQRQVTDLAELLGWTWCHWRALRNGRGIWQVPVEGPLGKGWPDLTLVRERDRRLVFAELKRWDQDPTPEQVAVLELLEGSAASATCGGRQTSATRSTRARSTRCCDEPGGGRPGRGAAG